MNHFQRRATLLAGELMRAATLVSNIQDASSFVRMFARLERLHDMNRDARAAKLSLVPECSKLKLGDDATIQDLLYWFDREVARDSANLSDALWRSGAWKNLLQDCNAVVDGELAADDYIYQLLEAAYAVHWLGAHRGEAVQLILDCAEVLWAEQGTFNVPEVRSLIDDRIEHEGVINAVAHLIIDPLM